MLSQNTIWFQQQVNQIVQLKMQKHSILSKTNQNGSLKKMTNCFPSSREKTKENLHTQPCMLDSAFSFKKPKDNKLIESKNQTIEKLFIEDLKPLRLKSHRSRADESSINKSVASRESSHQKHALKPCPMPKITTNYEVIQQFSKRGYLNKAQIAESHVNSEKQSGRNQFLNQFVKIQAWEQTKNDTIQSFDQLKRNKNPGQQMKIQIKCQKHLQLTSVMQDMQKKFRNISQKLSIIQARNAQLYQQIEQARSNNCETQQVLLKLNEQKEQLLSTKDKWQKGKQKLQVLYAQICLRVAKQKEKENMGKEDCQNYFGTRTKETKVIPKQQQRKPNLASRIKLRVERT